MGSGSRPLACAMAMVGHCDGFAVDDPVPTLTAYANEMGMNYPVLGGRDDVLAAFGPMVGLPTTLIIARDGRICSRCTGLTSKDRFERDIGSLLTNPL